METLRPNPASVTTSTSLVEAPIVVSTTAIASPGRARRNIATVAQIVFIISMALVFAYVARAVVLPVLLACMAAVMLKLPVRWLHRLRLPMTLSSALVVAVFAVLVGGAIVNLGRPALEWIEEAPENFPRIREKFHHLLRPAERLTEAASNVGQLAAGVEAKVVQPVEVKDNRVANTLFTWTGSLVAGAGETLALLFLLLASGDLFLQKIVRITPRLRDKKQAVEISREIQQSIATYLQSVTAINLGFGIAVGLALAGLGLPNAWMWGGVAAFANFIPYLGPILGITSVALAGLLSFDTLGRALLPAGAYLVIHLVEANFVTPYVLGRRFALNPVIIFVALIFCAALWGILGALLAVPLLVVGKVICDRVPALASVGEMLGQQDPPVSEPARDEPPPAASVSG